MGKEPLAFELIERLQKLGLEPRPIRRKRPRLRGLFADLSFADLPDRP